ncbi:methylamine dehydrogenase accessory protein MauD [Steroidobacter sp.]|uniref:methylamine dehydrogenase accessory protein MauD n=1 Tax=Steroidobacter sp. TaxID=1978227 RepID=UPI001A556FDC|nr:methylamine dehydrogenase accessory protein MauD [Steroidobacter sp.]MBL8266690.1 methylamine dehydrogenase accessory protein MauD [Steroidobacter sp.]
MSIAAWTIISILWIVVVGLIFVVVALARQVGIIHERIRPAGALHLAKGLKVGEAAPVIETPDVTGRQLRIGAPNTHGRATLIAFVSPTCPVCKSLLPVLRSMRRSERANLEVILASDGAAAEHLAFIANESLEEFSYVLSEQLGMTYGASRLPYAVLVDASGTVRANGLVNTREHLESLLEAQALGVANIQEFAARKQRDVA